MIPVQTISNPQHPPRHSRNHDITNANNISPMAYCAITNVQPQNPSNVAFSTPLTFEISFECLTELESDPDDEDGPSLDWKVTYVGSSQSESYDQILDDVSVGPVLVGTNTFTQSYRAIYETSLPHIRLCVLYIQI